MGYNATDVQVVIQGANFFGTPTATLGSDIFITIIATTTNALTGTVPAGITPGVYHLTITNPDGQSSDPLLRAYIASPVPIVPAIPLESPYLVTFGTNAKSPYDTPRYQTQVIFFEVPSVLTESLYVRIFDADTGGLSFVDDDQDYDGYDTTMRYTLYGLTGTLQTATISESVTLDNRWDFYLGPFSPDQGEFVGDRYIFELAVEGLSGKDANWYRVALSTSSVTNTVRSDVRMFAFSWTVLVREGNRPYLHPYVKDKGEGMFRLQSFGCDFQDECLLIWTPSQNKEATCMATHRFMPESFDVEEGEDRVTWTVDFSEYNVPSNKTEYLGLWIEDGNNQALRIFTRPTS